MGRQTKSAFHFRGKKGENFREIMMIQIRFSTTAKKKGGDGRDFYLLIAFGNLVMEKTTVNCCYKAWAATSQRVFDGLINGRGLHPGWI